MFWLPKRFSLPVTVLLLCFGTAIASTLDNSIGGHIFDLYDIMDGPEYANMDLMVYPLYEYGYLLYHSFALYLLSQTATVYFYKFIARQPQN